MATSKKSGKKGGASAKKGRAKGGAKKGGSKKGGSRGLGSVLSSIGSIASTVGTVAGAAGTTVGARKELRVAVRRDASFNEIVNALKRKFTDLGHPGCKSGYERFILEDIAAVGGGK